MTVQFKEQDRVAILGDTAPLRRGVFIGYIGSRLRAAILLESGNLEQVPIGDLISADKAPAEDQRLQMEFENVREQIAENLRIAAEALREATNLALSQDKTLQSYKLSEEVRPFLEAFDEAGWNSSSLTC